MGRLRDDGSRYFKNNREGLRRLAGRFVIVKIVIASFVIVLVPMRMTWALRGTIIVIVTTKTKNKCILYASK